MLLKCPTCKIFFCPQAVAFLLALAYFSKELEAIPNNVSACWTYLSRSLQTQHCLANVLLGRFQHYMFLQQFQASGYRLYHQLPYSADKSWVTFLVRNSTGKNCRAVFPQGLQMTLTFVKFFIQVQKKLFQGQRILFVQALENSKWKFSCWEKYFVQYETY